MRAGAYTWALIDVFWPRQDTLALSGYAVQSSREMALCGGGWNGGTPKAHAYRVNFSSMTGMKTGIVLEATSIGRTRSNWSWAVNGCWHFAERDAKVKKSNPFQATCARNTGFGNVDLCGQRFLLGGGGNLNRLFAILTILAGVLIND